MALFMDGAFVPDPWRRLDAAEELPKSGHVFMSPDEWHRRTPLRSYPASALSNVAFGVTLEPDDPIDVIAPDLQQLALVAVSFPKFTDGRGYSIAQLLRGRYGFKGQLRATGDVLFDQLQLMARCGFDAFEIKDPVTIGLLEKGQRPDFHRFYQPGRGQEIAAGNRRWRTDPAD